MEKHAVQAIIGMLKSSVKAWIFGAAKLIGRLIINPDNEPFILPFGPQKCDLRESSLAKVESKKECFKFPLPSPDYEIKETKNIYVDSNESLNGTEGTNSVKVVNGVVQGRTRTLVERFERRERLNSDEVQAPHTTPQIRPKTAKISPMLNGHPQITERELTSANDGNVAEDLMRNHDVFLSTLRSRLTKLQVVRHFWERNNIKGAIDATRKLPDHSVQADLISILMEKMEILTLDLFSCLLPVLLGLLDSKMERHASISLEMLLKLVAVFGPVVHSTISAPPAVGVDLHAEQRLECCNQCFIQLQKIHKYLPMLVRRGGLLAKCAQELNVVLQNS